MHFVWWTLIATLATLSSHESSWPCNMGYVLKAIAVDAFERSHKSLNSYLLVEYNKIYPNTNPWKFLQEESLWQEDFDNLYF